MLAELGGVSKIIIAVGYTDLRLGINGLAQVVGSKYDLNPFEKGTLFLFCGRKTDRFKVELGMSYNIGGYGMSMSEGTFYDFDKETNICLASSSSENMSAFGLNMSDESDDSFECIHFELKNVTLPSVQ